MPHIDSFSPVLDTPAFEEEAVLAQQSERRRHSSRNVVLGLLALGFVIGFALVISKQGWARTANQVHGVAEAVRDTGVAVKETSADAATTAKAKAALALSKRVSALDVNVDTTNAIATLTGTVPTSDAKDTAGTIVADTSGVRDVRNLLTVDPTMRPKEENARLARRVADLETQTALSEALNENAELDGARVRVRVVDGVATLDGLVRSEAQKERAGELARTFPGVERLSNRLQ